MAKLFEVSNRKGLYLFNCPGCKTDHFVNTNAEFGGAWNWNGNVDNPTVSPSLLIGSRGEVKRCHSFIRNGMIEFLNDCEHDLCGKTVEIPEYSFDYGN